MKKIKRSHPDTEDNSLVLISDDEDTSINQASARPIRQVKLKNEIMYVDFTSDEDEGENVKTLVNKIQVQRKAISKVKKKSAVDTSHISQIFISDDEDYEETVKVDQSTTEKKEFQIKKEFQMKKELLRSIESPEKVKSQLKPRVRKEVNSEITLISDDEDNEDCDKTLKVDRCMTIKESQIKKKLQVKTKSPVKAKEKNTRKRKITQDSEKCATSKEIAAPEVKKAKTAIACNENNVSVKNETIWKDFELLANNVNLNHNVAKNVVNLLNDGSTIPFIARYRRNLTGNMTPEGLRDVKRAYDDICVLKTKIKNVVNTLKKNGQINDQLERIVKSSRSVEELDIIFAPFKPEGKKTLAQKAKALGLENAAIDLLLNNCFVDLNGLVDKSKVELQTVTDVEEWIIHILAHKIATDSDVLSFLREMRKNTNFGIETKKATALKQEEKFIGKKPVDESKFSIYFNFEGSSYGIKPHQILAINRGEHLKILSVKIKIPTILSDRFKTFCVEKWLNCGRSYENRNRILKKAIQFSCNHYVHPFVKREVRAELKSMAEKASYEVFSKNLKHILLSRPIKGQTILGIDPGYTNGCKIAVISSMGTVLDHGVIYPHISLLEIREIEKKKLKDMLDKHDCSLISLGDKTASKETEEWLTDLIKTNYFYPRDVKYTIVSEDGASVYSCSAEAQKEFNDLDINIISAVSLARRIQDPLAELVKVEPKHLGIGMYQHDLKGKLLDGALNEVVSECVSFVGVDLNTASQCLLRRIAGLTDKRATNIVNYREKHGPFISREQMLNVTGISPKVFQQCAGFLRVGPTKMPKLEFYKNSTTNTLDQTIIHPESYEITKKLLKTIKCELNEVGETTLITKIKGIKTELPEVSQQLNTTLETLDLIVDALEKPLDYDFRTEMSQSAFFCSGLKTIDDLAVGSEVEGRVKNVTSFGCFVDIGVGKDSLIHSSKMGGFDLQIGDRIKGEVCLLDKQKQRIGVRPTMKM